MFGKNKETEGTVTPYLRIVARFGKLGPHKFPDSINEAWYVEVRKKLIALPINQAVIEGKSGDYLSDIANNKLIKPIRTHLGLIMGRCCEDTEDVDTFLAGLSSDAWIYKGESSEVIKAYRENPELVMLRLLELFG